MPDRAIGNWLARFLRDFDRLKRRGHFAEKLFVENREQGNPLSLDEHQFFGIDIHWLAGWTADPRKPPAGAAELSHAEMKRLGLDAQRTDSKENPDHHVELTGYRNAELHNRKIRQHIAERAVMIEYRRDSTTEAKRNPFISFFVYVDPAVDCRTLRKHLGALNHLSDDGWECVVIIDDKNHCPTEVYDIIDEFDSAWNANRCKFRAFTQNESEGLPQSRHRVENLVRGPWILEIDLAHVSLKEKDYVEIRHLLGSCGKMRQHTEFGMAWKALREGPPAPTLSVIIPVYNAAKYLRACLDAVRNQVYGDYECICIDDGSSDESGLILDEYAYENNGNACRFRVIHQKNAGAWAARNAALEVAQGEWITFVDADDVVNRHWFEEGLRIGTESGADLVRLKYTYGRSLPIGFADRKAGDLFRSFNENEAFAWMWDQMAPSGFLWLCFIKRGAIGGRFLPQINCKEDSIWLLSPASRVKRVAQGEFNGYFYRATEGSLMKQNRKVSQCVAYLEAMLKLWNLQKDLAREYGCEDVVRRNIRASVDNDVIEWVMKRAKKDDLPRGRIREVYAGLESTGVFDGTRYSNRRRYWLGFLWWKLTGQIWAMKIPGMLFLWVRITINKVKG